MVHQVIGWRGRGGGNVVVSSPDLPDRSWYGQPPRLVTELRGSAAASAIQKILEAVNAYPYAHEYRLWPGPNSNTFTAYIVRRVPETWRWPSRHSHRQGLPGGRPVLRLCAGLGADSRSPVRSCRSDRRLEEASRSICSAWCSASTRSGRLSSSRASAGSDSGGWKSDRVYLKPLTGSRPEGEGMRSRPPESLRTAGISFALGVHLDLPEDDAGTGPIPAAIWSKIMTEQEPTDPETGVRPARKPPDARKTRGIRFSESEWEEVKTAAERHGVPAAEFVRSGYWRSPEAAAAPMRPMRPGYRPRLRR